MTSFCLLAVSSFSKINKNSDHSPSIHPISRILRTGFSRSMILGSLNFRFFSQSSTSVVLWPSIKLFKSIVILQKNKVKRGNRQENPHHFVFIPCLFSKTKGAHKLPCSESYSENPKFSCFTMVPVISTGSPAVVPSAFATCFISDLEA